MIAAIASAIIPGLGQLLNRDLLKAVIVWAIAGSSLGIGIALLGPLAPVILPLVYLWQIWDALTN
ncbi:MAG: DUF5683 domain-containing protein [Candidatus Nanohaloarchaea archaeon]